MSAARLFVSYSRKDEKFARRLATALSNIGADVWIDIEDIPAGMNWSKAIQQGLDSGQVLLLILSPESMASDNVANEWQYYFDHGKPVIPILYKPARVHFQLNRLQYIDFHTQQFDEAFDQLLEELERKGVTLTRPENSGNTTVAAPVVPQSASTTNTGSFGQRGMMVFGLVAVIAIIAIVILATQLGQNDANLEATQVAALTDDAYLTETQIVLTTTQGAAFQETETAQALNNVTNTPTATDEPPTATSTPTPTDEPPSLTPPDQIGYAGNPVTSNDDWTPIIREFDGVEMVLVPAGTFTMGSTQAAINAAIESCRQVTTSNTCNSLFNDEAPQATITFDNPFWIDRYEVTNADYGSSGTFSGANLPRTNITSEEAIAHCNTRDARLPTEAEWEYAARGVDGLIYPWGNVVVTNAVNICDASCEFGWHDAHDDTYAQVAPVGSFPLGTSWVGADDMAGNVWEWTSTIYESYPYSATDGREAETTTRSRTLRGSSWNWIAAEANTTSRSAYLIESSDWYGFRCAMDFDPSDLDQ
jgi:formylglycine-generating enzyme required for sulfatase activity